MNDYGYICPHCRESAPHGDERITWLNWHISHPFHRWWWKLKRKFGCALCLWGFHKHPENYAPAWWICERPDCGKEFHQKW